MATARLHRGTPDRLSFRVDARRTVGRPCKKVMSSSLPQPPPPAATAEELGRLRRALRRHDKNVFPPNSSSSSNGAADDEPLDGCVVIAIGSRMWGTSTQSSDLDCVVIHSVPSAAPSALKVDSGGGGGGVVTTSLGGGHFDVIQAPAAAFEHRVLVEQESTFLQFLCAPDHCIFPSGMHPADATTTTTESPVRRWFDGVRARFRPDPRRLHDEAARSAGKDLTRMNKLLVGALGAGADGRSADEASMAKAAKIFAHAFRLCAVLRALCAPAVASATATARPTRERKAKVSARAAAPAQPAWRNGCDAICSLSQLPQEVLAVCDAARAVATDADCTAVLAAAAPPLQPPQLP
mmetsp:Transcript_36958/g.114119  ORF Transcript_36958/g.114119 Transcript_36958/m.114119 type:complete len:352 (-) Transcript_36958:113-1168(-)